MPKRQVNRPSTDQALEQAKKEDMSFYNQEKTGRLVGLFTFIFFTARQILPANSGGMYPGLSDPLIFIRWCLVTGLFLLFLHAYIVRIPAKELANRPVEVLLPLICAPLPLIVILITQLGFQNIYWQIFYKLGVSGLFIPLYQERASIVTWGLIVMGVGELITILGMFWLRSSFSIFTEVRGFVNQGPYSLVRHPLYTGELISSWGYAIIIPTPLTLGGAFMFTLLQVFRAKLEEKKILKFYPDYYNYQNKVGFFFPSFKRKTKLS